MPRKKKGSGGTRYQLGLSTRVAPALHLTPYVGCHIVPQSRNPGKRLCNGMIGIEFVTVSFCPPWSIGCPLYRPEGDTFGRCDLVKILRDDVPTAGARA